MMQGWYLHPSDVHQDAEITVLETLRHKRLRLGVHMTVPLRGGDAVPACNIASFKLRLPQHPYSAEGLPHALLLAVVAGAEPFDLPHAFAPPLEIVL
jgi:hypothetical protein